jgi:hypothetical protein
VTVVTVHSNSSAHFLSTMRVLYDAVRAITARDNSATRFHSIARVSVSSCQNDHLS